MMYLTVRRSRCETGLVVVFGNPWIRFASWKTSDAAFGNRHWHP